MRSAFFLLSALALLAACGFRPVYGTPDEAAATCRLAIDPIPGGRTGQLLELALERQACGGQAPPYAPDYRLAVGLVENIIPSIVEPDATITRYNIEMTVTYRLLPAEGGKPLLQNRLSRILSYNASPSDFATTIAERDARERGIEAIAGDLLSRVTAWDARQ